MCTEDCRPHLTSQGWGCTNFWELHTCVRPLARNALLSGLWLRAGKSSGVLSVLSLGCKSLRYESRTFISRYQGKTCECCPVQSRARATKFFNFDVQRQLWRDKFGLLMLFSSGIIFVKFFRFVKISKFLH